MMKEEWIDLLARLLESVNYAWARYDLQSSQTDCSQQGSRNALIASRLHTAHRSFIGISSWDRELHRS
jgi:hypothetical protein